MNSVVMEINGNKAVILNHSGGFEVVKNKNYKVGQRLGRVSRFTSKFLRPALAAAATFIILLAGGVYAYSAPYTKVSLDVNPSIELDLNLFNRVIKVTALNGDAQKIMLKLKLLNKDITQAAGEIIDELAQQGYLSAENDAGVMITTESADKTRSQEILKDAVLTIERKKTQLKVRATLLGECVGEEVAARARNKGVSPGKLLLAEQYVNAFGESENITLEKALNLPVWVLVDGIRSKGKCPAGETTANGYLGGDNDKGNGIGNKNGNGQNNPTGSVSPNPSATPKQNGNKGDNGYNGGDNNPNATKATEPGAGTNGGDKGQKGKGPDATACPTGGECPTPNPSCTGDGEQNRNGPGGR